MVLTLYTEYDINQAEQTPPKWRQKCSSTTIQIIGVSERRDIPDDEHIQ